VSDITFDALVLPRELTWVAAMDWGHNQPGCIGWAGLLPNHRIHVIREWKFTWLPDEDIADGFKKRTKELGIRVLYVAGDPSMWIRDGRNASRGQSRAETFIRAGMPMRKAENARPDGWSRLHSFLRVPMDDEGRVTGEPLLTIDETCRYLRRSIPAQQSAKDDPDDVNTKGDDHGVDMLRYLVMSRPYPMMATEDPRPPKGSAGALLAELRAGLGKQTVLGSENVARG
jgi:hypothetical protein